MDGKDATVDKSPEALVGQRLTHRNESIATAESCSGGLIAHRLTNVAGASGYVRGGVVAYSNEAKTTLVGVSLETLESHGAVSAPVARQLAEGVRHRFGATWGIGVTGIAGPTGGTLDKPVGLVYIAVAGPNGTEAVRNVFAGDRLQVKEQTADAALRLLVEHLA